MSTLISVLDASSATLTITTTQTEIPQTEITSSKSAPMESTSVDGYVLQGGSEPVVFNRKTLHSKFLMCVRR
ncbi:hypothetical protein [Corynebacterium kutscheri]|uniref:hypothetical protein n=1 Tax=Corynebacterium kutscheri TaxID=35755 RepID=UPI000F81AAE8|nr:hypothetical protein [Corynebacterium kutscheri]